MDETSNSEPTPPPDDVVVLLDRSGLLLCLGPALVNSTIIESAIVNISPSGEWTVWPVFTVEGIEQFNAAAASCSTTDPDSEICPSNRLAIVDGYIVVSSPTVNAANFKRDQIVISGNFTESEARELAASLMEDGITLRPVLADLGPAPNS
ncbi:MAG: SecDF P1 head subdomain-containing protein [Acidimicrobiales bacterium]